MATDSTECGLEQRICEMLTGSTRTQPRGRLQLPEQTAIARYLDEATADIDAAMDRARREIELLQEYRTRLIADVVTGKIDVRGSAE